MKKSLSKILFFFFFVISVSIQAQNTGGGVQDISSENVDNLTDEELANYMQKAQDKGMTEAQLQEMAAQRNMKPEQLAKLKSRIENLRPILTKPQVEEVSGERTYEGDKFEKKPKAKSIVFGSELFSNKALTFEPNLKIATPQNYQLGPDDEVLIDIFGYSEVSYKLKVSPDGQIRIPISGPVSVGGLTIEQARKKITRQLSNNYSGINTGETSVSITLGNIRSIKVTILGEVNLPGTYTLPSLATTFNALYASGGPNKNGSFRNIKLIRNGKQIAIIDVYEFLLKGDAKGNVRLQDQDVIKVSSYETRVELGGEVKREGLYEVAKNETLIDVIGFAGGYTSNAYKSSIKVFRNTDKEKSVADVPADLIPMFIPKSGDIYTVDTLLERFSNRVVIAGAVFRPGTFALDEKMTLSQLIKKADGLREDAFMNRGLIYRLKEDNSMEAISFDLNEVMGGKDISLKREDNISILSKLDLREKYVISIAGEVQNPGTFDYAENLRVEDLIVKAGGLKESAEKTKIEIARRIKQVDVTKSDAPYTTIITYEVGEDLKTKDGKDVILLPFDVISIYQISGFQGLRSIVLEGEVVHPGLYTLTRSNEKISDVIARAGGLTASAFPDGAVLLRTHKLSFIEKYIKRKKVASLKKQTTDKISASDLSSMELGDSSSIIGIDLGEVLKKPGSRKDLTMEANDLIRIPRIVQTVKVSGDVLYPVGIQYEKGKSFKKYVRGAGGYTQSALKGKGFVVYANGSAASTHKVLLFFNKHPKIKPGAEIIIPAKDERKKISAVEIASITTSFATLLLLIYTITTQ